MSAKVIVKNTTRETVIKVFGSPGSETIDLATDILAQYQIVNPDKSQIANIRNILWCCENNAKINITRNGELVAVLAGNTGILDLYEGIVDTHNNSSDIVVEIVGGTGVVWIALNKDGYLNTIETAQFSIYDNPNVSGA